MNKEFGVVLKLTLKANNYSIDEVLDKMVDKMNLEQVGIVEVKIEDTSWWTSSK